MMSLERKIVLVKQLETSLKTFLEKELKDINDLRIYRSIDNKGIIWNIENCYGKICVINETKGGLVSLDFEKYIENFPDDNETFILFPEVLRHALQIYDRIKEYLEKNGKEYKSMCSDKIRFHFRQGIPCLTK